MIAPIVLFIRSRTVTRHLFEQFRVVIILSLATSEKYASLHLKQTLLRNHPAKNKKPSARLLIRCILGLFSCPLHNRHSQSRMYSVPGYHGVGEGDGE
jgi:hypothetical protein